MIEAKMRNKKVIKYPVILLALVVIGLLGYYMYIATLEPCGDKGWPAPGPSPLKFGPYYMITDQGRLYIGQTYNHKYEGPWVGNLTLLYMNSKGATFLIRYPKGTGSDFKVMKCKVFYPRTSENEEGK
jgi:hypothetical protein